MPAGYIVPMSLREGRCSGLSPRRGLYLSRGVCEASPEQREGDSPGGADAKILLVFLTTNCRGDRFFPGYQPCPLNHQHLATIHCSLLTAHWLFSCFSNSARTTCGLALPCAFFITCPNRKFATVILPAL